MFDLKVTFILKAKPFSHLLLLIALLVTAVHVGCSHRVESLKS